MNRQKDHQSKRLRKRMSVMLTAAGVLLVGAAVAIQSGRAADQPAAAPSVISGTVDQSPVDFDRRIRPILSNHCFFCHGPDEAQRLKTGGFRLDVREEALNASPKTGKTPIVPGDVDASELVRRIHSTDPSVIMPPAESHKALNAEQVDLLTRWIAQGAPYQEHWAFVAPKRADSPAVKRPDWAQNEIDFFVLARLEAQGLSPSQPADARTLIRRVAFDLTGLPPTLDEVNAFVNDSAPDAYEKLVDRLLDSPRYGEHMARFWLDVARYGDTHGLHLDNYREMWLYRDWVIDAFNRNLPFDQFITEQLAGDMLDEPTVDQLIASGFNRCNITTNEGGAIKKEVDVRNVVDRVNTTGTVFLGLTVGCAQCHDHKFDPISQKEYFQLYAFFNNLEMDPMDNNQKDHAPVIKAPSESDLAKIAELDQQIAAIENHLSSPNPEWDTAQLVWEQGAAQGDAAREAVELGVWKLLGPFEARDRSEAFNKEFGPENQKILADKYSGKSWVERKDFTDGEVHHFDPLDNTVRYVHRIIISSRQRMLSVSLGSDDGLQVWLNGERLLSKNAARGVAPDQDKLDLPLTEGESTLLLKINNGGGQTGFYFKALDDGLPAPVLAALTAGEQRDDEQRTTITQYFREKVHPPCQEVLTKLNEHRRDRQNIMAQAPSTLISKEREKIQPAFLLARGQYDQPQGDPLARQTPAVLPPMPEDLPRNRLGFARWLVAPQHPLTARVTVNRFWQQYFGTGLVKTSEDFGNQGDRPTHPELLDWLAAAFGESGWDVKQLQKKIVMSTTYRQSSRITPELREKDPANRLLARGPRFRLDAEMLRDQALAVSGLLVNQLGGPGVKPPQPEGLWEAVGYSSSNTAKFKPDQGDKIYRRSVYIFWKRTSPPPYLALCDAPSRESSMARRERTNTPLAALLMMNEQQYVEAARFMAQRAVKDAGAEPRDRARYLFEHALLRPADDQELAVLLDAYQDFAAHYQQAPEQAKELIRVGETQSDQALDASELAAWTMVANIVLNLDEVINKG